MWRKIIILFLSIFAVATFAANKKLFYEPKVVTLTGVIKIKTFPGAPGYESVIEGDDVETCPYLFLDHPIDVSNSNNGKRIDDADSESNVKVIQVATSEEDNWVDNFIGQHVRVTGTLFHREFGHHHTRVLIYSSHFEMAE